VFVVEVSEKIQVAISDSDDVAPLHRSHRHIGAPELTEFKGKLFFLQNNYAAYQDYAIVGTKGYTFEGPFYVRRNKIIGWDEAAEEHARKLVERELQRLRKSFELAKADGYRKYIMFLHYPPTNILEERSGFTDMAEEYDAKQVIYAHCHGESRFYDSIQGEYRGREYHLVSGDFLRWKPLRIAE
jgi:predicted phosphohydrolase